MSTEKPRIVVQDVLDLLKKGYTRYAKDDLGHGSIQTHYGLTGVEIKELFQHAKLKARKTIAPKGGLNIVDLEELTEEPAVSTAPTEEEVLERGTFTPIDTVPMEEQEAPVKEVLVQMGIMTDAKEVKKDELFS